MKLIGLTGRAGCGKDTVADHLESKRRFRRESFAAPLYAGLAAMTGYSIGYLQNRERKEDSLPHVGRSPRYLLQTLGTEWGRNLVHTDLWLLLAEQRVIRLRDLNCDVVITDVRFENEATWLRNMGGELWHIHRPGIKPVRRHTSEAGILPAGVDRGLLNDRTIADLIERVDHLIAS